MSEAMRRAPLEIVEHALACARKAGAGAADALLIQGDTLEARVRGEEIDFVKQARERVLGLRALMPGDAGARSALTSTSDLTDAAVARMAEETVTLARATAEDPAAGLPEEPFASDWQGLDLGLSAAEDRSVSAEARIEDARRAEAAARQADPRIVNSEGSQVSSDFAQVVYGNSAGFLGAYETASHAIFSEPIARQDGSMQRDYWMSVAHRLAALEDPASVGRRAAARALRRLGASPVPTCEVPVIFDPITAASLLRHLVACVSGYAVYRQSSFLAGKLGERVASACVSVIDDGRLPGGLGSRPFDGEGLPTRRNIVIERGRLATYLLDSYAARKVGGRSTGNAVRSAGSPPSVGATNLWLEPGERSLEEIVADTPRGLLVTELIGMGFNPVTGDYSRGAAGLWIEAGALTRPVEEITIAGNLGDMLADIDAIGSDLLWLSRVAAPSLRVARMTVAGAA
ncbi:MAG: TldD/PmbA family protein [Myxococcales bacterium]|nr:TldD/PmbA family protein [Myxococcales bacterium]MDH5306982.1 TldD/PmbA family protein [Myxococcales bacterium]MDH5566857.1 TldD/PmbA family protein [Myxococcales bacterium]